MRRPRMTARRRMVAVAIAACVIGGIVWRIRYPGRAFDASGRTKRGRKPLTTVPDPFRGTVCCSWRGRENDGPIADDMHHTERREQTFEGGRERFING